LVAGELLFDIHELDLTGVRMSPEDVGRVNPQCGDMRQLDHVIWFNEGITQGLGVKQVRQDEFWVPGHIPGRPLLPGVLMIEAGAQLSSAMYRSRYGMKGFIGFTRCDEVSFRGQVVPGDTLYLLSMEVKFRPRRFVCATQGIVDDRLVFEATITGMLL
jgi:3-hydroxyacyl-[acyl-carrier-protein] dehydratase